MRAYSRYSSLYSCSRGGEWEEQDEADAEKWKPFKRQDTGCADAEPWQRRETKDFVLAGACPASRSASCASFCRGRFTT
jgi:hypothetical protein